MVVTTLEWEIQVLIWMNTNCAINGNQGHNLSKGLYEDQFEHFHVLIPSLKSQICPIISVRCWYKTIVYPVDWTHDNVHTQRQRRRWLILQKSTMWPGCFGIIFQICHLIHLYKQILVTYTSTWRVCDTQSENHQSSSVIDDIRVYFVLASWNKWWDCVWVFVSCFFRFANVVKITRV